MKLLRFGLTLGLVLSMTACGGMPSIKSIPLPSFGRDKAEQPKPATPAAIAIVAPVQQLDVSTIVISNLLGQELSRIESKQAATNFLKLLQLRVPTSMTQAPDLLYKVTLLRDSGEPYYWRYSTQGFVSPEGDGQQPVYRIKTENIVQRLITGD